MIRFKSINALSNTKVASVDVKAAGTATGDKDKVADNAGEALIGPFVPGENVTIKVSQQGYDQAEQVFTVLETDTDKLIGLNPTVIFLNFVFGNSFYILVLGSEFEKCLKNLHFIDRSNFFSNFQFSNSISIIYSLYAQPQNSIKDQKIYRNCEEVVFLKTMF